MIAAADNDVGKVKGAGNQDDDIGDNAPVGKPDDDVAKVNKLMEQANLFLKNGLKGLAKNKLERILLIAPDCSQGKEAKAMLEKLK